MYLCVNVVFEFSVFVFLGFAGSSCRGPLWKPVLARRLKCRCRLPAGFVPQTCTVFLLHIKCICKSGLYLLLALCLYLYLPLYFSCYIVQGSKVSTAGAACAPHARTNYCRRSWEKLNSGHTFEFRPKNWVVLGNGTLGWPNFSKVLRNRDEGCVFHDMGGLWLA